MTEHDGEGGFHDPVAAPGPLQDPLQDPVQDPSQEPAGEEVPVAERDEDTAEHPIESTRTQRRAVQSARVRRRRRIVAWSAAGVLGIVALFVLWYELESHALGPTGPQVVVTVRQGESTGTVVSDLHQHGVIGSALAFQIGDFFHGTPTVLPGSYAMHKNQTFSEVRALLAEGPNVFPIDVRPGYTLSEVAARVDGLPGHAVGGFTRAADSGAVHSAFSPPDSQDLEGMLGTGTYDVVPGESDLTILRHMVNRFDGQASAAGLSATRAASFGLSPYQLLTVASIVEKEGYYPVNMPDVARVVYNRLSRGMPLQMDSTVLYALGQDGGPVTAQDEQLESPYNTYLNTGLTPTPICMPSAHALAAAADPPAGNWLYFVLVQKNGVMAFSDTYAEQLANEQLAKSRGLP